MSGEIYVTGLAQTSRALVLYSDLVRQPSKYELALSRVERLPSAYRLLPNNFQQGVKASVEVSTDRRTL